MPGICFSPTGTREVPGTGSVEVLGESKGFMDSNRHHKAMMPYLTSRIVAGYLNVTPSFDLIAAMIMQTIW